jgi:hypothetical protein
MRKTFASAWLHADADAYPDLYIANDFGENLLLRNRRDGTFEDITPETDTGDSATSMGVAAGDLDNAGATDVYVANMYSKMGRRIIAHVSATDYPPGVYEQILGSCAGNRLYRGTGSTEPYDEAGHRLKIDEVGWAYAPAMTNLDGDGLHEFLASQARWMNVSLEGSRVTAPGSLEAIARIGCGQLGSGRILGREPVHDRETGQQPQRFRTQPPVHEHRS